MGGLGERVEARLNQDAPLSGEVKASLGSLEYTSKSSVNKAKQHKVSRSYSLKLLGIWNVWCLRLTGTVKERGSLFKLLPSPLSLISCLCQRKQKGFPHEM